MKFLNNPIKNGSTVMNKKLTDEEMKEVMSKVADLQKEIKEDEYKDIMIEDEMEQQIQMFLTVS